MADRQLQNILSSGEITSIYIGGTSSDNAVVTQELINKHILAVGAQAPLTAQTVTPSTPALLTWFDTTTVSIGNLITANTPAQSITVASSGAHNVSGTIYIEGGNSNDSHTITMYVNGVATPYHDHLVGSEGTMTFIGANTFSLGDTITLYITSTATSIQVQYATVIVEKY